MEFNTELSLGICHPGATKKKNASLYKNVMQFKENRSV